MSLIDVQTEYKGIEGNVGEILSKIESPNECIEFLMSGEIDFQVSFGRDFLDKNKKGILVIEAFDDDEDAERPKGIAKVIFEKKEDNYKRE